MADTTNMCGVRTVQSPDGADIPIPVGGVGLASGEEIDVHADAPVSISSGGEGGYYVAINNADPSNDEAAELFGELATETGLKTIETLAVAAFGAAVAAPVAIAAFAIGQLVALFTPSKLTREIFIRATLEDGTRITYCILV
jgi:hypothetical protein